MELHAGLIIIVHKVVPVLQSATFEPAIRYLAGREQINPVIEVTLEGKAGTMCVSSIREGCKTDPRSEQRRESPIGIVSNSGRVLGTIPGSSRSIRMPSDWATSAR
jgi:hypothetical protein